MIAGQGMHRWIHVTNRGKRITRDSATHLLEPGRKGSQGGMGLGLHITRACAQKMGGELRLGSTRAGTVFSLLIPWREPPPPASTTPAPPVKLAPFTRPTSGS
jgi:signal transduction histidine kinase